MSAAPHRRSLTELLPGRHLPALDGFRAIAVGLVILYHFNISNGIPGDLGVTAFFTLSGFLITWLLRREYRETGRVDFRGFYLRRTLRIFPAYYVFLLLIGGLMLAAGRSWPPGQGLSAFLYVSNYFGALNPDSGSSISHTWSLAVEEQFYLLWPLAFVLLAKRGRRTMLGALAATIAAVAVWRTWLVYGSGMSEARAFQYVYRALDTRLDSLAIGCVLAVVLETNAGLRWARRAAASVWLPVPVVLGILASRKLSEPVHHALGFTIESALCAVLVVQALQLHPARGYRWLTHPVTEYLGRISYPLYLWHSLALFVAHKLPVAWPIQLAAALALSVALASGSYFVVEKPFLKLKDRLPKPAKAKSALGDLGLRRRGIPLAWVPPRSAVVAPAAPLPERVA